MKAEIKNFTIRELTDGALSQNEDGTTEPYADASNKSEFGVLAMNGKIVVRPSYQRNFVWDTNKQVNLIKSIIRGWIINPLVFAKILDNDTDFHYECVDGQQRIISLCNYRYDEFDYLDGAKFTNHGSKHQNDFLNYKLEVRVIEYDNDEEKIEHFTAINQPITVLTNQELRNATYNGTFVEQMKKWFGRKTCRMVKNGKANKYINLTKKSDGVEYDMVDRQELCELAILWTIVLTNDRVFNELNNDTKNKHHKIETDDIAYDNKTYGNLIEEYMNRHRNDDNCDDVHENFSLIIEWIGKTFDDFENTQMKNVKNWAFLYRKYNNCKYNPYVMRDELEELMSDPEIHHKHAIPEYLLIKYSKPLTEEEVFELSHRMLSLQSFDEKMKLEAFRLQDGKCKDCGLAFNVKEMEAHHRVPWSMGGRTEVANLDLLCPACHGKRHNYKKISIV